ALRAGGGDGVADRRRGRPATPAVAGELDIDPPVVHHRRVVDGGDDDRVGGEPPVEDLQGHQARGPVHPCHSDPVVARGADRPGDVRAVCVDVRGVAVVVDEVVTVDVVHEAVAVIVDAVPGDLAGVGP